MKSLIRQELADLRKEKSCISTGWKV